MMRATTASPSPPFILAAVLYCGFVSIAVVLERPILLALAALPSALILASRSMTVVVPLLILTFHSQLKLPGIPDRLTLFYTLAMMAVPVGLTRRSATSVATTPTERWAALLVVVCVLTIAVRGLGLRVLGSSQEGAFNYFSILSSIGVLLILRRWDVDPIRWRLLLIGMCLISAIPFIAEVASARHNASFLYEFVNRGAFRGEVDANMQRYASGQALSALTLVLFMIVGIGRPRLQRTMLLAIGLAASFAIAVMTGHRLATFTLVLLASVAFAVRRGVQRTVLGFLPIVILALAVPLLALPGHLPLVAQRSLSWVPGVTVRHEAAKSTAASTEWRFELWRLAIRQELPEYWLIGKGLTHPHQPELPSASLAQQLRWMIGANLYHNGPLSVLLTLGAPGLLCVSMLLGSALTRHYRLSRLDWKRRSLREYHAVIFSLFSVQALLFVLIYGDMKERLPQLLFLTGVLEALARAGGAPSKEVPTAQALGQACAFAGGGGAAMGRRN